MTQEKDAINQQLLDHLESGTWDPYRQQQTSPSDQARLVFDLQQRIRRKPMWQLSNKPLRTLVWVLVLLLISTGIWAYLNQYDPELARVDIPQPGQVGETNTPTPDLTNPEPVTATSRVLRFGEDIYLSNYSIDISKVNDNTTHFGFVLFWDSARDVTGQFNIFVHLIKQDGTLLASHEAPIFVSDQAVAQHTWVDGEPVEQTQYFAVDAEVAAAEPYQLFFGLYDTATGNRLPVSYFEQLQADNQLLLTEVRLDKNQELNITPQGEGVMVVDLQTLENPNVTINVHETQLLLLNNDNGTAVVAFQFADQDSTATYRWRYHPATGGIDATGEGILQEVYAQTPTADGFNLVDMGSQLYITIADMNVEWSWGNEDAGWFYYNPDVITAQAVSGDFDTFDLSSPAP